MLYSLLIYGSEASVARWSPQQMEEMLVRHTRLREELAASGRLGTVLRLAPDGASTMRRASEDEPLITDGPFAETKEQLMGLYIVDCADLEEARDVARRLAFDAGVFEIRPVDWYDPGGLAARIPREN